VCVPVWDKVKHALPRENEPPRPAPRACTDIEWLPTAQEMQAQDAYALNLPKCFLD
jgi:hypothetical protein